MNAATRKEITEIFARVEGLVNLLSPITSELEDIISKLEDLQGIEQDKFDNMPEGLQQSEQGQKTEAAAAALDEAKSTLEQLKDALDGSELEDAKNSLETASE